MRSMFAFAHADAAADLRRRRQEARVGETLGEVALRVVQRALVAEQRLEDRPAALGCRPCGRRPPSAAIRARPAATANAILESAEDAPADELGLLRRDVVEVCAALRFASVPRRIDSQQHLLAQRELDRHGRCASRPTSARRPSPGFSSR